MYAAILSALLPLLVLVRSAAAQNTGSFSINASIPTQNPSRTGCIVLAPLTGNIDPPVLQALVPVCHGESPLPSDPTTGLVVNWPIAANVADGQGLASPLLIYAQMEHNASTDVRGVQAGCVMQLTPDQAQYFLGRSLTWNNGLQELWDNTGNGFVLTPAGDARAACTKNDTLLPGSLSLPDPYFVPANDSVWRTPITLGALRESTPSASVVTAGIQTDASASSSGAESIITGTATTAKTSTRSFMSWSGPIDSSTTMTTTTTQRATTSSVSLPAPAVSEWSTSTSFTALVALETPECSVSVSVSTVTEHHTTTVTATPTTIQRRGLRMYY